MIMKTMIKMLTMWSFQGSWEVTNQGVAGLAGTRIFVLSKDVFRNMMQKYEHICRRWWWLCVRPRSDSNRTSRLATDPFCTGFFQLVSTMCFNQIKIKIKSKPTHFAQVFNFVQLFSTGYFKMVFSQTQIKINQTKIKTHPLRCECVLSNISLTNCLCSARRVKGCLDPSYRFPTSQLPIP